MDGNPQSVKEALISVVLFCRVCVLVAQYDQYNFRNFPSAELIPLASAYGQALDHYAAENWTESIKYMELSLRLHRLLRDSVTHCIGRCNDTGRDREDALPVSGDLQVFWRVMMRASCLRKCRAQFPALSLPYPRKEIMDDFERRSPYRYLYFAHFQTNDLQRAVSCAHTYLQKNPGDQLMTQHMDYYKSQLDLESYLINLEEQPHEDSFLRAVTLFNAGDFSGSVRLMEQTLDQYLQQHQLCQAGCEGAGETALVKALDPTLSDGYVEALRCKVNCEGNLMPNVGGYFVEKFMATVYHYLQYAYYKLSDARRAAPCASSHVLFDPDDEVMRQNLQYYRAQGQQWGLQDGHFTPRAEALGYYNQTTTQKQMLALAENYLQSDQDFLGPEEAEMESPDVEFEGVGDYEESFYAKWLQPKGKGDIGETD